MRKKILTVLLLVLLVLGIGFLGLIYWMGRTERKCWNTETELLLQQYGSSRRKMEVLEKLLKTQDKVDQNANPLVVEFFNGCGMGSSGQSIVEFYFDKSDRLTNIKIFQAYIASNTKDLLVDKTFK